MDYGYLRSVSLENSVISYKSFYIKVISLHLSLER